MASAQTDSLLKVLDAVLLEKEKYTNEKLAQITEAKQRIKTNEVATHADLYTAYLHIFEDYKTLNFDSAYHYAIKTEAEAINLNDDAKISRSRVNLAFILLSSGLFSEALEVLNNVNIASLNNDEKIEYYTLKARYYYDRCDFVENNHYCRGYLALGNLFADSAIHLAPIDSYAHLFVSGLKKLRAGDIDKALSDYTQLISRPDLSYHQYAIIASTLSFLHFQNKQETAGLNLLIKAAIADVKSVAKENTALLKLAELFFNQEDNDRAYSYIQEAMADAEYYGAKHRQFKIGALLPIIEGKQLMLVQQQKTLLFRYAVSVTLLIVLAIAFTTIIIIQLRKLKAAKTIITTANTMLTQVNTDLRETNLALREANHIKDEYIGYYFNVNSEYIDKIERFKKTVSHKLLAGRHEDIKQIIDKIDLKKEREYLSLGFDQVFIKLFPNFIQAFNELFDAKNQITIAKKQILNTELRIFALIRLGIHENDKIAKILGLAVNTIYSYKTRVKNKSFVSNDEFEKKIMEIKADQ